MEIKLETIKIGVRKKGTTSRGGHENKLVGNMGEESDRLAVFGANGDLRTIAEQLKTPLA